MTVGELIPGAGYKLSMANAFGVRLEDLKICFTLSTLGNKVQRYDPSARCPDPTFFIPPGLV